MSELILKNVHYSYQTKHHIVNALQGINYTFTSGSLYGIIGKSGSGKSTLLSLMAGLDLPSEGEILINGVSTHTINRDLMRQKQVSVIYQNYNLFPLLTIEENVLYPLQLQKMPKEETIKIAHAKLLSVGLDEEKWKRLPSQLSGGEQQRVAIARAIAMNCEFILADEPTGNLDSSNSQNIVKLLRQLADADNRCVIIVTHDLNIAKQTDATLYIQDGKLIEPI